jgi:hypothetical protein
MKTAEEIYDKISRICWEQIGLIREIDDEHHFTVQILISLLQWIKPEGEEL